ncbi:PrpF domain-containing protein [Aquabacterium sp.]|uniref:PrpF domain-containing protein n=1 Tax=Aquabacterium sp. TaxID=1872578 RepID=UPI0035B388E3
MSRADPHAPLDAVWMRGDACKGLFFRADDLPRDYDDRVQWLARLMGSPDPTGRQIDGLGAGSIDTSCVVVLSRSKRFRHDIDYWCGKVDPVTGLIDSRGAIGDLAAAAGPAAVWLKLVEPQGERAALRLWQVNEGYTVEARFDLQDGQPVEVGDFRSEAAPFPGAAIELTVFEPGSSTANQDDDEPKSTRRLGSARRLMQGIVVPA